MRSPPGASRGSGGICAISRSACTQLRGLQPQPTRPAAGASAIARLRELREKTKKEAKAKREKLLAVQLELAQAEAAQSLAAGQINNIHVGKVSQGFRASKAAGTVEKLVAELTRADEVVDRVRQKLRTLQGFSSGEVSRV